MRPNFFCDLGAHSSPVGFHMSGRLLSLNSLTHKKMSANKCCEIILGQSMDDKTHSIIGWLYTLVLIVTADKTSLLITSLYVFPSFAISCVLFLSFFNKHVYYDSHKNKSIFVLP